MGESTSDYLVHSSLGPATAVGLGFAGFVIALVLQFTRHRYVAWTYWLAVVMVGVFGTMAADVLHVDSASRTSRRARFTRRRWPLSS